MTDGLLNALDFRLLFSQTLVRHLGTNTDNTRAVAFYERAGFQSKVNGGSALFTMRLPRAARESAAT